jgi:hypothetical protein
MRTTNSATTTPAADNFLAAEKAMDRARENVLSMAAFHTPGNAQNNVAFTDARTALTTAAFHYADAALAWAHSLDDN